MYPRRGAPPQSQLQRGCDEWPQKSVSSSSGGPALGLRPSGSLHAYGLRAAGRDYNARG